MAPIECQLGVGQTPDWHDMSTITVEARRRMRLRCSAGDCIQTCRATGEPPVIPVHSDRPPLAGGTHALLEGEISVF
jgi:hypothetical protein